MFADLEDELVRNDAKVILLRKPAKNNVFSVKSCYNLGKNTKGGSNVILWGSIIPQE